MSIAVVAQPMFKPIVAVVYCELEYLDVIVKVTTWLVFTNAALELMNSIVRFELTNNSSDVIVLELDTVRS